MFLKKIFTEVLVITNAVQSISYILCDASLHAIKKLLNTDVKGYVRYIKFCYIINKCYMAFKTTKLSLSTCQGLLLFLCHFEM